MEGGSKEGRNEVRKNTADRYRANVIGFYAINGRSVEKALERTTGEEEGGGVRYKVGISTPLLSRP